MGSTTESFFSYWLLPVLKGNLEQIILWKSGKKASSNCIDLYSFFFFFFYIVELACNILLERHPSAVLVCGCKSPDTAVSDAVVLQWNFWNLLQPKCSQVADLGLSDRKHLCHSTQKSKNPTNVHECFLSQLFRKAVTTPLFPLQDPSCFLCASYARHGENFLQAAFFGVQQGVTCVSLGMVRKLLCDLWTQETITTCCGAETTQSSKLWR